MFHSPTVCSWTQRTARRGALQLILAALFVSSAVAAGPPRLGIMIDIDKSASTVDCAAEVLTQVTDSFAARKRVELITASEAAATWQELAAANDLAFVTVISVQRSTVKFASQVSMGRGKTANIYKANTELRVRIMETASEAAIMDETVKGRATAKEPVTGIPLIDGIMFAAEASKSQGSSEKKTKKTDEYAQKYETTLLESVAKATQKLHKKFLKAMPIRGVVTATQAKTASLDVGADWAINKKHKFVIYRPASDGGEDLELGVLSVKSTQGNTTVLKGSKKVLEALQVGDLARSK